MKVVGFDIDGTLTVTFWKGRSKLTKFIPSFFFNLLVFSFPRRKMIRKLRAFKKAGDKIILVSNRSKSLRTITIFWLWLWRIPYDELILVGRKNKALVKAECIEEKKVEIFYDDSQKIIKYLQTNLNIKAKLV